MSIRHAAVGLAPHPVLPTEKPDLRKRPIYKARALPVEYRTLTSPLGAPEAAKGGQGASSAAAARPLGALLSALVANTPPPRKQTTGLPIGTQARFIDAAARAASLGYPLNTTLTVNWRGLFSDDDLHPLRAMETLPRIRHLVELLRKWLTARGVPAHYVWVRETAGEGEHWHMGLHCPVSKCKALGNYLAELLGEPQAPCPRTEAQGRTKGEVACGSLGSWHLARDMHPEREGYFIAAYLGKGEPSRRVFRGQLVNNTQKPVRGRRFGGTVPRQLGNRYDVEQGHIVGTTARKGRFDIARALK
jgi:hypothetical protein